MQHASYVLRSAHEIGEQEAFDVLSVAVPALFRQAPGPEILESGTPDTDLGVALVDMLQAVLSRDGEPWLTHAKLAFLRLADDELKRRTPQEAAPVAVYLVILLQLMLAGESAGMVANALSERPAVLSTLMAGTGGTGSHARKLAGLIAGTFFEFLQAHGAAPSAVLQRCGVQPARLLGLVRSFTAAQQYPPLELLELVQLLARDAQLTEQAHHDAP